MPIVTVRYWNTFEQRRIQEVREILKKVVADVFKVHEDEVSVYFDLGASWDAHGVTDIDIEVRVKKTPERMQHLDMNSSEISRRLAEAFGSGIKAALDVVLEDRTYRSIDAAHYRELTTPKS